MRGTSHISVSRRNKQVILLVQPNREDGKSHDNNFCFYVSAMPYEDALENPELLGQEVMAVVQYVDSVDPVGDTMYGCTAFVGGSLGLGWGQC